MTPVIAIEYDCMAYKWGLIAKCTVPYQHIRHEFKQSSPENIRSFQHFIFTSMVSSDSISTSAGV